MNIHQPLYLFFDLDGTVLLDSNLPKQNLVAMQRAQQMGHKLILNTGRSRGGYARAKQASEISWDGMCFSASDINYQGNNISFKTIDEQDFYIWLNYCMEHRIRFAYCGREFLEFLDFAAYRSPLTEQQKQSVREHAALLYRQNPLTNFSVYAVLPPDQIPKSNLTPIQLSTYADIFPKGCNKGKVILDFCHATGALLEQCVCFGDSANDIDMFRVCPTSVCMRGAPQELTELSTYQAKSKYGVAEGLMHLLCFTLD